MYTYVRFPCESVFKGYRNARVLNRLTCITKLRVSRPLRYIPCCTRFRAYSIIILIIYIHIYNIILIYRSADKREFSTALHLRRTMRTGGITNHINVLADISGFSRHFGAKFQILLRYANLLITVRNRHVDHTGRRRIAYVLFAYVSKMPLEHI